MSKYDLIKQRATETADHMLLTKCTVREAAKKMHTSKSTVHKDMAERLPKLDNVKAMEIQQLLQENYDAKHIRGGESTRRKYERWRREEDHESDRF